MANHRAAALLIASLLVAVVLADARLTMHIDALGRGQVHFAKDVVSVPSLTCKKVHGVKAGETCFSLAQATKLTQDQFIGFNPNINCEELFVGQWVCLAATSA